MTYQAANNRYEGMKYNRVSRLDFSKEELGRIETILTAD